MPIKVPDHLPAIKTLNRENIFVMSEVRACTQDIRPLRILLLNLMPTKIVTETQIARLVSNTPLQVELELLKMSTHQSKNTSVEHMLAFYKTFDEVCDQYYDGMIITGAPVEDLAFEAVTYWEELKTVMDWSVDHVYSTLHICWGAMAGLYHHFGVRKEMLSEKLSGVYEHTVTDRSSMLFRGFDDVFYVPHSRNSTVNRSDIYSARRLKVLAQSPIAGIYALSTAKGKQIYLTGHVEYDALTLDSEYRRDLAAGIHPAVPENYYRDNDPDKGPVMRWRASAHLLFANWLNYFVYQETPYDLKQMKREARQNLVGEII